MCVFSDYFVHLVLGIILCHWLMLHYVTNVNNDVRFLWVFGDYLLKLSFPLLLLSFVGIFLLLVLLLCFSCLYCYALNDNKGEIFVGVKILKGHQTILMFHFGYQTLICIFFITLLWFDFNERIFDGFQWEMSNVNTK